ncbi:MAG: hypothetical protein KBD01_02470 [Acidobacteria bacterium]|nr:hypothetical protein [Acidobacteriota bacterium]
MNRVHEVSSAFHQAKILLAGAELGVFDRLRGDGATAQEVAAAIGGTLRGTEILLDALVALGFITKHDGVYRNVPEYEADLVDDSPSHTIGILRHRNRLFRGWAFLEEVITGRPVPYEPSSTESDATANENFIRAMYAVSHQTAGSIVDRIDLAGVKTVADLAGGPGHYLAEFVRRAPAVDPYLIDLPPTLEVARRIQRGNPLAERFHYVAWDVYGSDAPRSLPPLDLVFVSQLVHAASAAENRELLRRIFPVVSPGGRVVIHEKIVDRDRTSPVEAAVFAVNMLAMTEGGRTYTVAEIEEWGRDAGFEPLRDDRVNDSSHLVYLRRAN